MTPVIWSLGYALGVLVFAYLVATHDTRRRVR